MYQITINTPSGKHVATLIHKYLQKSPVGYHPQVSGKFLVNHFYQTWEKPYGQSDNYEMLNNNWNYDFVNYLITKRGFIRTDIIEDLPFDSDIVVLKGKEYQEKDEPYHDILYSMMQVKKSYV